LSAGKLSKTEGIGRDEAMDGGGGHLKAWMPIVPGTLPEPEGRALVLSLWNIGATMQNISFEYFLTLSTNCREHVFPNLFAAIGYYLLYYYFFHNLKALIQLQNYNLQI